MVDGGSEGGKEKSFSPNHRRIRSDDPVLFGEIAWRTHSYLRKGVQVCELGLSCSNPRVMSPMMSPDTSSPGTRSWVGTNTKVFSSVLFWILHDELLRIENQNESSKKYRNRILITIFDKKEER